MMHGCGYGTMAPYTWATANGWGWAGLIVMALGMLVFWGCLIAGVVLLARPIAVEWPSAPRQRWWLEVDEC